MRTLIAVVCAAVLAALPACSPAGVPSSLFDSAGYHVRGDTVFFLQAFPGKAAQVEGADAASFTALDRTFATDASTVYVSGRPLPDADPSSFVLLDRPDFAKDGRHVYQRDKVISDDPAHFQLLGGNLAKDDRAVYWSDGRVLSEDPEHFSIVSDADYYLFTKDGQTVQVNGTPIVGADPATFRVLTGGYAQDGRGTYYFTGRIGEADAASFEVLDGSFARDARRAYWMGRPIPGADGATFRVLNANFECAADRAHAYYREEVIEAADPRSFPPGRAVTGCSESAIYFVP
ncbi:MAG: DKNYY domain-containing protein [Mycolicibacterium sp.]|nr:DKNYY domain-containing protein [Mycolicibacterium sp.]